MYSVKNLEKYYSTKKETMNNELFDVIRETVCLNNPVGALVGYYDDNLTLLWPANIFSITLAIAWRSLSVHVIPRCATFCVMI